MKTLDTKKLPNLFEESADEKAPHPTLSPWERGKCFFIKAKATCILEKVGYDRASCEKGHFGECSLWRGLSSLRRRWGIRQETQAGRPAPPIVQVARHDRKTREKESPLPGGEGRVRVLSTGIEERPTLKTRQRGRTVGAFWDSCQCEAWRLWSLDTGGGVENETY